MWNQQFGWLVTTPNFKGILTIGWGKRWSFNYMTPLCDNYQTAHLKLVPIVCFVAIQTRTMAKRVGINWSLFEYSTSSRCLQCLGGMRYKGWQMIQLYPYKNGICSRLPCQGLCLPYLQQQRRGHQFMPDVDMKRKKSESWPKSWYTESRRLIRWGLYLKANDEEQTTVNDLIVNIKKFFVVCDDDNDP